MAARKTPAREVTIRGYVNGIEEDDELVGVEIETDDDIYRVVKGAQVKPLMAEIDNFVEVTGIISEDDEGNSLINVVAFEIIDEEDDDEDFYDDDDEDAYYDDEDDEEDDLDDDEEDVFGDEDDEK
jgi:hypothetical protein